MAITIITVGGTGLYLFNFKSANELDVDAESIVGALRDAQQRSINQEETARWGIRFTNQSGEQYYELVKIFSGGGFGGIDVVMAVSKKALNNALLFADPAGGQKTISFEKITGVPHEPVGEATAAVEINGSNPPQKKTITVNQHGVITIQ